MAKTNYPEELVAEWYDLLQTDLDILFTLIITHRQPLHVTLDSMIGLDTQVWVK